MLKIEVEIEPRIIEINGVHFIKVKTGNKVDLLIVDIKTMPEFIVSEDYWKGRLS